MSGFLGSAFDELKGAMGDQGVGAAQGGNLLRSAFDAAGGVQGIAARAEQAGLGDKLQSWIGTGGNIPMALDEVTRIFPPAEIEGFAAQHGVPAGVATQILAQVLPHAVDAQTPDSQVPAGTAGAAPQAGGGGFDFMGLAERFLGNRG